MRASSLSTTTSGRINRNLPTILKAAFWVPASTCCAAPMSQPRRKLPSPCASNCSCWHNWPSIPAWAIKLPWVWGGRGSWRNYDARTLPERSVTIPAQRGDGYRSLWQCSYTLTLNLHAQLGLSLWLICVCSAGLDFHGGGEGEAEGSEAGHAGDAHEDCSPGVGEDEHGRHFVGGQVEQAREDEQANRFVAANLAWRRGQDVEHVVDGVAEDGGAEGDGVANRPESEHGEEAVEGNGDAGEQHGGNKDSRLAGTHEQRVDEAGGEALDLVTDAARQQACQFLQQCDGDIAFPGGEKHEEDQADEQAADDGEHDPELDVHLDAQQRHDSHDEGGGHEIQRLIHRHRW